MPDAVTHPSLQELTAFNLGRLPEAAAAAVASHLEGCAACRGAVEKLPPDSFVGKIRAAKSDDLSLPRRRSTVGAGGSPSVLKRAVETCSPPTDLLPELANYAKYRFVRELGRGGMGIVYQAEQTLMDRTVAIKVINPSMLEHADALARFHAEVKAAAKLDHPNIVRAYDAEQVGNLHLLVMEYVEGWTLAELVHRKGPLTIVLACNFIRQAALGLQHAFEQGMVHRDIKPGNLMLTPQGRVKILDFGLARLRSGKAKGDGLTEVDSFLGTPEYVSPEQATDARMADIRADLYSLGCTLYFLLTGRPPFQEETMVKLVLAQIEKEPPPLQDFRPVVPAELSAVVARLLAKDPAQRYQKPVELTQALMPFIKPGSKPGEAEVALPPQGVALPATGTVTGADTSHFQEIRKGAVGKARAKQVVNSAASLPEVKIRQKKADEAASSFASLADAAPPHTQAKKARAAAKPAPAAWYRRGSVMAGVGAVVLMLGLVVLWASGVFKAKTPDGTIIVEGVPADAEVQMDRPTVTLTRNGEVVTVTAVSEGPHRLKVVQGGQEIWSSDVTVKLGGDPIRLKMIPPPKKNAGDADQGFVLLFNGKDLSGWKKAPDDQAKWKVEDGVLIGSGDMGHLFYVANSYENFRLRVQAMINDGGNGGVFFRTPF